MAEPIVVSGDGGGRDRRKILMLAGAGAFVLLAVLVLPGMLFGGGGGTPTDEAFPPVANGVTAAPQQPAEPAPPETFETFSAKNPFDPLVSTTPASSPASDPEPELNSGGSVPLPPVGFEEDFFPDSGGFDAGSPTPVGPAEGADSGSTSTPTTAPAPPPRQPDRVSLLEVFTDQAGRLVASVRVNDITYVVGQGEDFAVSYRVLDLDPDTRCGRFLFGDDRFSLCEGDEIFK